MDVHNGDRSKVSIGVDSLMSLKGASMGERLPTFNAMVTLLQHVGHYMCLKGNILSEGLITVGARVEFLPVWILL